MPDPAETRRAAPERIELANGYYWRRGKDHVGDIYYVLLDRHGNRTLAYDAAIRERAAADGETVDWRARAERLAEALRPFVEYTKSRAFELLPDGLVVTNGSPMARQQITVRDLRRAAQALADREERG